MGVEEDWESLDDFIRTESKEMLLQTIATMTDRDAITFIALVVRDALKEIDEIKKER